MLVRFLRDSAFYSVSAVLTRGVAIILVPLYTRFLHPAEYGALDLLMVFATLANYLVSLEISQGVARVYAEAKTDDDKQACISSALWFAAAAYGLFVAVAMAFSAGIAEWLLDSATWDKAVRALILTVGANGMFFLLQDLLRWQLQPLRYAVASIVYAIVSAAVGASMVILANAGVPGILYGQCAGAVVGLAVSWWNGAAMHWKPRFHWERWREMASYSAPQVVSSFAGYFSVYLDRLLIKELMTLEDVGIYGVGARIASVVALLMAGFQSGIIPIVFHHHAAPDTPREMARVFRYFLVLAIALLLFLAGFSKELLWLFTTTRYYGSWGVVPLLAAALMLANMYIFVPGIFIARRTGLVAAINVGTALLNLAGNFLLIPAFGTMGAAAATLTSSLVTFLLYVYLNRRFYPIPFEWSRIVGSACLGAGLAALLVGMQGGHVPQAAGVGLKLAICLAGSAAAALVLLGREELMRGVSRLRRRPLP